MSDAFCHVSGFDRLALVNGGLHQLFFAIDLFFLDSSCLGKSYADKDFDFFFSDVVRLDNRQEEKSSLTQQLRILCEAPDNWLERYFLVKDSLAFDKRVWDKQKGKSPSGINKAIIASTFSGSAACHWTGLSAQDIAAILEKFTLLLDTHCHHNDEY